MRCISWVGIRNALHPILYLDCDSEKFQKGAILPSAWKSVNIIQLRKHSTLLSKFSFTLENWRLVQWWKQHLRVWFSFWKANFKSDTGFSNFINCNSMDTCDHFQIVMDKIIWCPYLEWKIRGLRGRNIKK